MCVVVLIVHGQVCVAQLVSIHLFFILSLELCYSLACQGQVSTWINTRVDPNNFLFSFKSNRQWSQV